MAIVQLSYAQELESLMAQGMSFEKAHEVAAKKHEVRQVKKKPKKVNWFGALKKRIKKLYKRVRK